MDENVEAALVTELAQRLSVTEMEGQYLPRDIVLNILARLPLKSLVRFQSVCENWRGMIYDLDAILVQQSMSKVTITYGSADGRCLFFKLKNNNRQVCSLSLKTEYIWAEKACSNKFVLFSADDNGRRLLSVYNAITDQFRLVPEIPSIFHTTRYVYSLVYDASAETCKVILFHCEDFIQHCCIYSFNDDGQWGSGSSGDWRTLQLPCSQKIMKSPNSAIDVNGILYWVAKPDFEDYGGFIQPMDIAAEKFKTFIEVPCQPWKKNCHLLQIKESLCFMNTACVDELHIWMLKNSDSLWILNHKISLSSMVGRPISLSSFLHHNFNPWLVVEGIGTTYIMVTLDGIYVPYWYNIETKELRHISMAGKDLAPFCEPFMLGQRFELTFNISEVFCLRTISFIDDLRPDFQSKFSGFIIAEKERQREREQEHEQLRSEALLGKSSESETAAPAAPTPGRTSSDPETAAPAAPPPWGTSSEPETATPAAPTPGSYVPRRLRGKTSRPLRGKTKCS
ncbi:F-box protein [Citrus sinensis]|nr:F-box protein [Citrus sinensis]